MEQKMFENEDGKVFYREYYLEDLLEGINLGDVSKEVAIAMCKELFKSFTNDMILNNDYFMLPERDFGRLYVRDIVSVKHPDYQYDIDRGDTLYQPVMNLNRNKVKGNYIVRFMGNTEKLFQSEIANNHNY